MYIEIYWLEIQKLRMNFVIFLHEMNSLILISPCCWCAKMYWNKASRHFAKCLSSILLHCPYWVYWCIIVFICSFLYGSHYRIDVMRFWASVFESCWMWHWLAFLALFSLRFLSLLWACPLSDTMTEFNSVPDIERVLHWKMSCSNELCLQNYCNEEWK